MDRIITEGQRQNRLLQVFYSLTILTGDEADLTSPFKPDGVLSVPERGLSAYLSWRGGEVRCWPFDLNKTRKKTLKMKLLKKCEKLSGVVESR